MTSRRLFLLFTATLGAAGLHLVWLLVWGRQGWAAQDVLFVLCCALCASTAWVAAALHPPRRRRPWQLVALAFSVSTLGNACWVYLEMFTSLDLLGSVADVAFLLVPALLALAFWFLPHARIGPTDRGRLSLDATILAGTLALWGWRLVLAPTLAGLGGQPLAQALAGLYPLLDVLLLSLLAWLIPQRPPSAPVGFFALGAACFVVGDVAYAHLNAGASAVNELTRTAWLTDLTGYTADVAWLCGLAAFAAAAWSSVRLAPAPGETPPVLGLRPFAFVLPYLALVGSFVGLHFTAPRMGGWSAELAVLTGLAVLVAVRQGLVWQDKLRLEAKLQGAARCLEARVEERTAQVRRTFEGGLLALGVALETRDLETSGHTQRVVHLALALGQALGLPPDELDALAQGAYLHDLGKLAVPDAILRKPGRLTPEEFAVMQTHAEHGHDIALRLPSLAPGALAVILHHHERWDGSGYPCGLTGLDIPLLARMFAVCDVYDALTSERPYKRAWSHEAAVAEIAAGAGRHFDPCIVRAFMALDVVALLSGLRGARTEKDVRAAGAVPTLPTTGARPSWWVEKTSLPAERPRHTPDRE